MRIYKRYTNFIPESYIKSIEYKNSNGEIRMIKILVILALIALPLALNTIIKYKNIKEKSEIVIEEKKEVDKTENLLIWIEAINKDKFNGEIEGEKGMIKVKDMMDIKKIEENNHLKINSVKLGSNEYSIEVNIK